MPALRVYGGSGTATTVAVSGPVPYDISCEVPGSPNPSTNILNFKSNRSWTLKASGSVAGCITSPTTGNVTFTIKKNGASIGSITYTTTGAGEGSVTISGGSDVNFLPGNVLSITAPANLHSIDTVFFNLLGSTDI